jgi:predicted RNase H-like HicB family nuclease
MTLFAVVYELANDGGWNARAADLPVYTVGDTREEAEREITAAIRLYLGEMAQQGNVIAQTAHDAGMVRVEVPSVVAP